MLRKEKLTEKKAKKTGRKKRQAELKEKEFFLVLSPDLINRPDRLNTQEFISRGYTIINSRYSNRGIS